MKMKRILGKRNRVFAPQINHDLQDAGSAQRRFGRHYFGHVRVMSETGHEKVAVLLSDAVTRGSFATVLRCDACPAFGMSFAWNGLGMQDDASHASYQ